LGLPIVASRTGGIPDVITDGVSGLLVPPGDPEALARTIDHVLSSPDLVRRLGEAARERAKDYDWEVLAGRVLKAYRDVTVAYERRHAPGH
jgi:glycosyltransferase involved in cell wall biosynthesis